MPRKRAAPRLYLDAKRGQWVIRDGGAFVRTGCAEVDRQAAEAKLHEYLGTKWAPSGAPDPSVAEVLIAYGREHAPHIVSRRDTGSILMRLGEWWAGRQVSDVTAANCRAYAAERRQQSARKDLQILRAALAHWDRNHGPLRFSVVMPPAASPRDRWLTKSEAARLLWAARRVPHLARFILLGLYTGSRPGVTFRLTWSQVDLNRGVLHRRPRGQVEQATKQTPPVKLGRRILSHLRRWRRLDPPGVANVCHYGGRAIHRLSMTWPAACQRAGLIGVTPHTLRHTRATWLMQAGVDIWQASGALGMSPAMLARTYGHHSPEWQKEAAEV
jgi:integrase